MWRRVIQSKSVSATSRCGTRQRNRVGGTLVCTDSTLQSAISRSLSSAQPSPWDDHSPFTMSAAPSMAGIPNPTAERVVMKTFLNTLQVSAVVESSSAAAYGQEEEEDLEEKESIHASEEKSLVVIMEEEQQSRALVAVSSVVSVPEDEEQDSSETIVSSDDEKEAFNNNNIDKEKKRYHGRLVHAIRTKNAPKAKVAFRECLENDVLLSKRYLVKLFNVLVYHDTIAALAVLKHYRSSTGTPAASSIYATLCQQVGKVPWKIAQSGQFTKFCHDLREELIELPQEGHYQRRCFPIFLVSLVQQPMHRVGRMARGLYNFMEANDYPLSVGKMCHILAVTKYTRQDDLPFPTILARIVKEGYRPYPPLAIAVLQNLFPYTNIDDTISAMKSIIQLQSSWEPGNLHPNYKVDIGTLEHIMAAAARKGSFELNILVWDLMDLLGYEPTECMYENTLQGFVMGVRQDNNVFMVLSEMEERGFVPSRALIRSLSRSMRFSERRVDHGHNLVVSKKAEGTGITQASLNVLLSAAAELGDVDRAFATFDDFDLHGVEPNSDSFSFLLEALSKSVSPLHQKDDEQRLQDAPSRMDAASAILSLMEESGIKMCQHCNEQYALLLSNVDRLDAATEFLLDSLERGDPVNNRLIISLTNNNALAGNIEIARLLAERTTEHFAHLDNRIDKIAEELGLQEETLDVADTKTEEDECK